MYKKLVITNAAHKHLAAAYACSVNLLDFGGSSGGCPTSYITRGQGGSQVKIKKRQNEKYVSKHFKNFSKIF